MEAMSYEYLIRRIYQVGRSEKREADADVYRKLELSERIYYLDLENIQQKRMRCSTKRIEDLEHEYKLQCRKIWSIVTSAIQDGILKYESKFSSDEVSMMKAVIVTPKALTKQHIDDTINTIEDIYVKHEIYPQ